MTSGDETVAAGLALMPSPTRLEARAGGLALQGRFEIVWRRGRGAFVERALARFQRDLERLAGEGALAGRGPTLVIDCGAARRGAKAGFPAEDYELEVAGEGAVLSARGPVGVLRGLATLRQLLRVDGPRASFALARIEDAPRFVWRGLMIDTARHFMPASALKRQIDAMEQVKLSVLHLHLSDNEAFRVESRRFAKLHEAASRGRYYRQSEIRDLVAYAADRGVMVVPEIDVPAHVGAILRAYPELRAAPVDPNDRYAALNGVLDPSSEDAYRFVEALFGEMAALFPAPYFHLGGDEVNAGAWDDVEGVRRLAAECGFTAQHEVEAYFHGRVAAILKGLGKTPIGWEEVAAACGAPGAAIQAWRTSNGTALAVRGGHPTIVSAGYYLDQLTPAAQPYAVDPFDLEADGFTPEEGEAARKASPMAARIVEPLVLRPLPPLHPDEAALILGAEGALWSELVDAEMLDGRLWPRAAALAERFWSDASVRDPDDMHRRLAVVQDQLRRLGLQDLANRQRMAARLASGRAEPVLAFLDLVAPVRHAAHNQAILAALRGGRYAAAQVLTALADAAGAESLVARRFEAEARRFADGDLSRAPLLRAELESWIAGQALFAEAARGRPALEAALPVSALVARLADGALAAAEALAAGGGMEGAALANAREAIAEAEKQEAASARPIFAFMRRQPPADLIVAVTAGVKTLVEAAAVLQPQARA